MGSNYFSPRRYNNDGSRNVYCPKCMRLIGSLSGSDMSFGSAICAICDSAEKGIELSDEIIDALTNNVRLSSGFMAPRISVLPEAKDIPSDPIMGKNFRQGVGYWVKIIKNAVFSVVGTKEENVPLSKQVAITKKRSRVFALEDNDPSVRNKDDSR